jgi:hypothetical protein
MGAAAVTLGGALGGLGNACQGATVLMRGCVSLVIVRRGLAALKGERQLELERRLAGDAVKAAEAVFDNPTLGNRVLDRGGRRRGEELAGLDDDAMAQAAGDIGVRAGGHFLRLPDAAVVAVFILVEFRLLDDRFGEDPGGAPEDARSGRISICGAGSYGSSALLFGRKYPSNLDGEEMRKSGQRIVFSALFPDQHLPQPGLLSRHRSDWGTGIARAMRAECEWPLLHARATCSVFMGHSRSTLWSLAPIAPPD